MVQPHMRNARFLDLSLTDPAVVALREKQERLRRCAVGDANSRLRALKDTLGYWRFAPSRLAKCPRDRALLTRCFTAYYSEAIVSRLPELTRLDRKLWRICSEWPLSTAAQLSETPPVEFSEMKLAKELLQ